MRLFIVLCLLSSGCAAIQKFIETVDDVADAACKIFGKEHPEEFKHLVLTSLPPGADLDNAEKNGFNPKVLCQIFAVNQSFRDSQKALHEQTAAGLRAGMSSNDVVSE